VTSVEPGTIKRIEPDGTSCVQRYWSPAVEPDESMSYDDAVAGARARLLDAVGIRLRADVPLAFCMSGGVDSNSLIAIARRVFDYDVHGFTIQNSDARYEEQEMVDYAVRELGIRHTGIPADTDNFLPKLRGLVRQHDAPVYTITYFAHWLLMGEIAAAGYRIAISGTAADELFTGYYDHHLAYLYEVRHDRERHAASVAAWRAHIQPIVRNPLLGDPDAFVRNPAMREHIYLDAVAFSEYLRRPWSEGFSETQYSASLLRNRMLNELFHEAVPVILHEDDLNAMSFSIENRSPFLDRRLFEFTASIPTRHLIRDGYAKAILRDAMAGIVPPRVLESRRKVGFNAPIHAFLDPADRETRAALLDQSPIFDHVRREKIEQLLDKSSLPNSESKFLFYFLNAKMFLEEFA
jgi:asparagine synthase (glutamine-hydrolysing)